MTEKQPDLFPHLSVTHNELNLEYLINARTRLFQKMEKKKGAMSRIAVSIRDDEVSLKFFDEKIQSLRMGIKAN